MHAQLTIMTKLKLCFATKHGINTQGVTYLFVEKLKLNIDFVSLVIRLGSLHNYCGVVCRIPFL